MLYQVSTPSLLRFHSQFPPSTRIYAHNWEFFFYNVCCQTSWPFGKISKTPVCSLGFLCYCLCSNFSVGNSEDVNKFVEYLHVKWIDYSVQYLLGVIRSFFKVAQFFQTLLSGGVLFGYFSLGSLFNRGSKILGGPASQLQVMLQEFFSIPSCFVAM